MNYMRIRYAYYESDVKHALEFNIVFGTLGPRHDGREPMCAVEG